MSLFLIRTDRNKTDEGQPKPKYTFNKCGTNINFFYSTEV